MNRDELIGQIASTLRGRYPDAKYNSDYDVKCAKDILDELCEPYFIDKYNKQPEDSFIEVFVAVTAAVVIITALMVIVVAVAI